ncbi:MAG: SpoIVB peptidase, partial [Ruminococcus sp.]|nr:SpoIVB peptidase [Ruminococcus sp.]
IPCGTPFGIKLMTEGVMVVELTGFDSGGKIASPARDAGIEEGDVILSISGKKVSSNKDVSGIIEASEGKTLGVEIMSGIERRVVFIKPEKSASDDCYRAGMWVRDSSAGIGTVTFYDPVTHVFAGLGHPVCDRDTGEALTMSEGESADVVISGVKKSSAGSPGELIGMFADSGSSGKLLSNSECGLFGTTGSCPSHENAVPVAMRQEIAEGEAQIIATVSGSSPVRFDVEIEKIDLSDREDSHNMVIHVTDSRLLEKAGGIVQGMSGSPILQNGKLVGAVTHVLVRDPTRGYGIFADTMVNEARKLEVRT